ncbi:MAG: hypothetical protein AAGF99_01005 [Bacteroidota bacterium]
MSHVRSAFFVGLDLGQAQDYTALCVIEQRYTAKTKTDPARTDYHLRHLERFQLGTSYPAVAERVKTLMETPPLAENARLAVDATGVGRPVVDMMDAAGVPDVTPIVIHGGDSYTYDLGTYRVPKRELASTMQVLLQTARLKIADGLPLSDVLVREMQAFKVKVNIATGHDSYEAWREGDHDDVVLAVAMALWLAEHASGFAFVSLEVI